MSAMLAVVVACLIAACGGKTPTSPDDSNAPRTLYVSLAGSDSNAGSQESPWRTIRYGVSRLRAGDTLYVRGGTYSTSDDVIDSAVFTVPSGSSWSNVVTIAGHPGETVVIQPPNNTHALRLTNGAPSYIVVRDLTLDYSNDSSGREGIYLSGGANHNRFLRVEVRYAKSFGVVFSKNNGNSAFNEVIECDIHHTGNGSGDPTNGHGAYVSTSDNVFRGNVVHDNQGYGLHFYDNGGALLVSRNVIEDNRVFSNGTHGGTAYGVVVAWGDGNRISGNSIYGNPGGILVYTRSTRTEVSGNTIYSNAPLEGVFIQGGVGTIVKSNTIYGNGVDIVDLGERTVGP
jgi:parallel beta-helix repeat protein